MACGAASQQLQNSCTGQAHCIATPLPAPSCGSPRPVRGWAWRAPSPPALALLACQQAQWGPL
jgi:hypothetical protein